MTDLFTDTSMAAVELAMKGVAERQRTSAHNIANLNTPGFRSHRVAFESALADALGAGRGIEAIRDVEIGRELWNNPRDVRGNDVSLEGENRELIAAGVQYEALVGALNFKFGVLRTAIGS